MLRRTVTADARTPIAIFPKSSGMLMAACAPRSVMCVALMAAAAAVQGQSPVDSSWILERGDTLLFHRDGTREFRRTTRSRELRFPDGRRLYFFAPTTFLVRSAFPSRNFQEINAIETPARSNLRFRLAPEYSTPTVAWSTFPRGEVNVATPTGTGHSRELHCALGFVEPGWHVVEISATGGGHTVFILARMLVCVGDRLPMPFDTVSERHPPPTPPPAGERLVDQLGMDRDRSGPPLALDTLRAEAASMLVAAGATQKLRWAVLPTTRARTMLGTSWAMCDSNVTAVIIATGHSVEDIAWNVRSSPTHRSLGLLKLASRVAVGVMRSGDDVLAALMVEK